jgi:RNA polymerase sigma-70 factor (ECF subfamily)
MGFQPGRQWENQETALDQRTAEELLERYSRLIYYLLNVFDLPKESHQDLFNQVFVKIMGGLKALKHKDNIRSWVSTITRNEIRSYLRRREREASISGQDSAEIVSSGTHEGIFKRTRTPEEEIYDRQLLAAFDECVEELEEKLRKPFLLRYREFLKWEEIASILGIGVDKVRRRAEKARQSVIRGMKRRLGMLRPVGIR